MKVCSHCKNELSKFASLDIHENACWNNPDNRTYCECCGTIIKRLKGSKYTGKFCSSSCAAKVSNANREVTWGEKTRKTINEYYDNHPDFRNTDWNDYKAYRKRVDRYSVQQLKDFKPELYEYWQSNPYRGSGDTSKLSVEHTKMIMDCYKEGLSVEEAGDISNLEIIPYKENNARMHSKAKKA